MLSCRPNSDIVITVLRLLLHIGGLFLLFDWSLRIDNSWRSVIYHFLHMAGTMLLTITCNISKNRVHLSLSYDMSDIFIRVDLMSM